MHNKLLVLPYCITLSPRQRRSRTVHPLSVQIHAGEQLSPAVLGHHGHALEAVLGQVAFRIRLLSKGEIPPPNIEAEICDAGFVYTNRLYCLAVEDCRQIQSRSTGLLV